jgi:hypothetical protein
VERAEEGSSCPSGRKRPPLLRPKWERKATAVDIALRSERHGLGAQVIVREPSARRFGKWAGEGVTVVLLEKLRLGDQGVEITGRELLGGKR